MPWGRIDLLSDFAMVGGDIPRSVGCDWTFFRLAKEATNKLASGLRIPCRKVKTWTTLQLFTLHIYVLLLGQIWCTLSPHAYRIFVFILAFLYKSMLCEFWAKTPRGLSIMRRLLRPVQVWLRRIHAGVSQLPITLFGCVSSTLRNLI